MTEEIIIAGFGGQGVLSMGKIIAYSGLMQGLEVITKKAYWEFIKILLRASGFKKIQRGLKAIIK